MENNGRKKILIAYVDSGAAHQSYSRTIINCLENNYPGRFIIKEMDYIKELGPASLDRSQKNAWLFFLKHHYIGDFFYFLSETIQPVMRAIVKFWSRKHIENSARFLSGYKPDLIIAPHPVIMYFIALNLKKLGLKIPFIGIDIEPFEGGAVFAHPEADLTVVFSDIAKKKLVKRGVPEEKISVYDFLVSQKFLKDFEAPGVIRKRLGLKPDLLTIYMSSGGEGIGNIEKYIKTTVAEDLPVQLLVVTGRNEKLKKDLEAIKLPAGCKTALKVLGYVNDVSDLIFMADMVFNKGGACSTIETLFMKKPVMFYKYVMGNEKQSVKFAVNNGLGWYVPTQKKYLDALREVLADPAVLGQKKNNYAKFDFKNGTVNLCKNIAETLGN